MKRLFLLTFVIFSIFSIGSNAMADVVVYNPAFYTENFGLNPFGWSQGHHLEFGAYVHDDDGVPDNIFSVVATGDGLGSADPTTLNWEGGNLYWASVSIEPLMTDLGRLTITAINEYGGNDSITTNPISTSVEIPLTTNIQVHDFGTTPFITWDHVYYNHDLDESTDDVRVDGYHIRIYDADTHDTVFRTYAGEGFTVNQFLVPYGYLDFSKDYHVRIIANDWESETIGQTEVWFVENRSSTWEPFSTPPDSETATVDIFPDTLNKKSRGNFITCYLELSSDYSVEDIDIETVDLKVNNLVISAELFPTEIGDYNDNRIPDLMFKFDRQRVQDACSAGTVVMAVYFETYNGKRFEGIDTILVIDKGKEHFSEDQGSVVY